MDYLSIPHYRGLKSKYNKTEHEGGVYFTTDTHEIIANDVVYTKYIDSWAISDGVLTLTMSDSSTITITFNEASETEKGFLSAEDKKRLNQFDALKEQVTELTQTVEDNELVTAQALNNINDRINSVVIDDYLSDTSTNAIQNKTVTTALSSKADLVTTGDGTKFLNDKGEYVTIEDQSLFDLLYPIIYESDSTVTEEQYNAVAEIAKIALEGCYVTFNKLVDFYKGGTYFYIEKSLGMLFITAPAIIGGHPCGSVSVKILSDRSCTREYFYSQVYTTSDKKGVYLAAMNDDLSVYETIKLTYGGDGTKFLNDAGQYVTVQTGAPTWDSVTGKPTFATVATSGSYNDLSNKPTIITSEQVDNKITSALTSVYRVKGSVASYSALPTTNVAIGDVYNVEDTGANYVATSTTPEWDKLSETVDLSGITGDIDTLKLSISNLNTKTSSLDSGIAKIKTNINKNFVTSQEYTFGTDNVTVSNNVANPNAETTSTDTLTLNAATTSTAGVMSAADKTKLNNILTTGDGTKYLADDGVYKEVKTGKDTTVYDILINAGSTLTTDQLNTLSQYVTSTDQLMSFDVGLSDSYPIRGVWGVHYTDSNEYLFYLDIANPGISQYLIAIVIDSTGAVTQSPYLSGVSYSENGPTLTYFNPNNNTATNMALVNNGDGTKFLSDNGTYQAVGKNTAVFEIINNIKVNSLTTLTTEQLAILQANVTSSNTAFDLGVSDGAYIFTDLSGQVENSTYTFYTVYSIMGLIPQYEVITIKSDGTITSDARLIWLEASNGNIGITAGTNLNQTQITLKGSGDGTKVLADNGNYISHTPIVTLTQTQYDALETKDSSTLYIITE